MDSHRSAHVPSFRVRSKQGTERLAERMHRFWGTPYLPFLATGAVAGLSGMLLAVLMPRGPVDAGEGLALLVICLLTGGVAGFLMRSRWAMVVAPLTNVIVFELARLGQSGPSVDRIRFEIPFGILALLVGRGVYVLFGLVPMVVGAAYGAWIARHLSRPGGSARPGKAEWHSLAGWIARAAGAVAVAGLAILLVRPASVPPVTDANGNQIDGSIAELTKIELGGHDQWIEIRGASADNPVILYLNGGPGQSDLALSRALLEPLHQDFTVVGWDQRGAGKSYGSLDAGSLTLERVVADTIELTNYLRERFAKDKIYLLTESWGSIPGVLAVQQHPELYHAYIGSGQMVNVRETDRMIYEDLLAYAEALGDQEMVSKLEGFGPPPYADIWAYAYVAQHYDLIQGEYDPPKAYTDRGASSGVGFWGIMGSEYTVIDKANVIRGLLDMAAVMYPQLQNIDFIQQAATLEVPVYLFDGEQELRGRRVLAHQWFDALQAPAKGMYTFADAGHAPAFEHADDLRRILLEEIVPEVTAGLE